MSDGGVPEVPISAGGDTTRLRAPLAATTLSITGAPGTLVKVMGALGGPSPAAFDAYATNLYWELGLKVPEAKMNSTCVNRRGACIADRHNLGWLASVAEGQEMNFTAG